MFFEWVSEAGKRPPKADPVVAHDITAHECIRCAIVHGSYRYEGAWYCEDHKPEGAMNMGPYVPRNMCADRCGKSGSFRYDGRYYCRSHRPPEAVSILPCAEPSTMCATTASFRYNDLLYCAAHRPVGAVSIHICASGCGVTGKMHKPDGAVRTNNPKRPYKKRIPRDAE
jgi:hypothetical protein